MCYAVCGIPQHCAPEVSGLVSIGCAANVLNGWRYPETLQQHVQSVHAVIDGLHHGQMRRFSVMISVTATLAPEQASDMLIMVIICCSRNQCFHMSFLRT